MTKKEQEYLENLEECFSKLLSDYEYAQNQIKDLRANVQTMKEVCNENFIQIPDLDGPCPF